MSFLRNLEWNIVDLSELTPQLNQPVSGITAVRVGGDYCFFQYCMGTCSKMFNSVRY
ncbi:MAG: hypothetical protein LBF88_03810 [Planctomycetaceae bacterium]|nr:hypothetical protein [Planctomycetaceae bacterium]